MTDEIRNEHNTPSEEEHAIHELEALKSTLDLSSGDGDTFQSGGSCAEVRARLNREGKKGYEVHHMPSNAAQNAPRGKLPGIALTAEDHAETDSYRGKQNRKTESFLPDSPKSDTYHNESAKMIETGRYAELVTDEVYNIKDRLGDKYDGALAEYLDSVINYIRENGIPEPVYSKKHHSEENSVKAEESKDFTSIAGKTAENKPIEAVNSVDSTKTVERERNEVSEAVEKADEANKTVKADDKADKADKTESSNAKDKKEENKKTEKADKKENDDVSRDSFLESIKVDITSKNEKTVESNKPTEDNGESTDQSSGPEKGQRERSRTTADKSSSNDPFLDSIAVDDSKTTDAGHSQETSIPSQSESGPSQSGTTHSNEGGYGESSNGSRGESSNGGHGESSGGGHGR